MSALRRVLILVVLSVLLLPAHVSIAGGTYTETKAALEEAVSELKDSLDDLENYADDCAPRACELLAGRPTE